MPSNKDLANEVIPKICSMWREVGTQLNLDIGILNEIDDTYRGNVRQCCTRMFEVWLKQDTEASWITVMSACSRVRQNLASSLISSPDQPYTKNHIEALNQMFKTLPTFLEH